MDHVRRLLLVLAIACSPAMADILATMPNNNGGIMVLTDVPCKNGNSHLAYTQSPKQSTLFGCWFADKIMVHIIWNDGDARSYSIDNWDIDAEAARRFRKRENSKGSSNI